MNKKTLSILLKYMLLISTNDNKIIFCFQNQAVIFCSVLLKGSLTSAKKILEIFHFSFLHNSSHFCLNLFQFAISWLARTCQFYCQTFTPLQCIINAAIVKRVFDNVKSLKLSKITYQCLVMGQTMFEAKRMLGIDHQQMNTFESICGSKK